MTVGIAFVCAMQDEWADDRHDTSFEMVRCAFCDEGCASADGAAAPGGRLAPAAAPAPSPVSAGEGVTPVNDRLYEELLKPIVERFYEGAKALGRLPVGDDYRTTRTFRLGQLDALEQTGDLIAEAILVACPDWAAMEELALASIPDGPAASSPAAGPRTPGRAARAVPAARPGTNPRETT